jgi:methylene-fatty-acyl-phospholipid synthase
VTLEVFAAAAVLLALERVCYVWAWRAPDAFRSACTGPRGLAGDPTDALRALFVGFKALQAGVFVWWWLAHADGAAWPPGAPVWAIAAGALLIGAGQALNLGVFYRLGSAGVFYGNRFGYAVPWCDAFPFSVTAHPQYVGTVLTIWGVFLVARFPHDDWFALPALESVYYFVGARLERPEGCDPKSEVRYPIADNR